MKEKVAILFSGGKDSCLALHKSIEKGYDIKYLLNIYPKNSDSFMFHKPDLELLNKQAEMLGIELIIKESKGEKEKELDDLKEMINLVKEKVDGIVVGGIASSYQGKRIKKICSELGLKFIAPLWNYDSERLWRELLKEKFKVILTKISCEGLGKEWLGKIITRKEIEKLKKLAEKYRFRLDFEGGEAESAVLDMPGFKNQLRLECKVKSENKYRHFLRIKKIKEKIKKK